MSTSLSCSATVKSLCPYLCLSGGSPYRARETFMGFPVFITNQVPEGEIWLDLECWMVLCRPLILCEDHVLVLKQHEIEVQRLTIREYNAQFTNGHTHPCGNCGELMYHDKDSRQSCKDFISWITNACIELDGIVFE